MTTRERFFVLHIAVAAALVCLGLLGFDRLVAAHQHAWGYEGLPFFLQGTGVLDIVTGKELSKFLIGLLLAVGGLALRRLSTKARDVAQRALFVGSVQLSSTLVLGVSKNLFGRLRPFELLQSGDWAHAWFASGSSFPSGHAAFYFGLFMPLAYLFPRFRWPLLLIPWFIVIARVNANHHFVSDVAASIVVVGLLTLLFARLMLRTQPATLSVNVGYRTSP